MGRGAYDVNVAELHPFTVGGSGIAAICGLDPYVTPYAYACRLLGVSAEPEQSEAAALGLKSQGFHAELLEDAGYTVLPAPADGYTSAGYPWLHFHPDALTALDGRPAPVEMKLRGRKPDEATWLRDTVQTLVYVHGLEAEAGLLSELHGGYGFGREERIIARDDEAWTLIAERVEWFLDTVRKGKMPAPTGSDADRDALRSRFAHAEPGKAVRLTQTAWASVRRIRELDETIAAAKVARERHAQIVQAEMGEATEAVSPYDTPAARWRAVESHRLDTKALRAAHPAIAEEFTKLSTSRRFEANP